MTQIRSTLVNQRAAPMPKPHIAYCEDGSILIEWLLSGSKRFGISIEREPSESGWYFVSQDEEGECGELPPELTACFSGLYQAEMEIA